MRFFYLIPALLVVASGLHFVPNQPGLIPDLSKQVSSMPGGWRQVDLQDQREKDDVEHLVRMSLYELQKTNPPGAAYTNFVKAEQAIEQVVDGTNYKVVFLAKQRYPFRRQLVSQFGQCYFKMFKPLNAGENAAADVSKHICVEIPINELAEDSSSAEKDRRH
uniref:Cystatin domain-containing protein n=1 Tax=Romanomermis culicivorax TaxID=13658 RepID=A0A915HGQ4_ROMCU